MTLKSRTYIHNQAIKLSGSFRYSSALNRKYFIFLKKMNKSIVSILLSILLGITLVSAFDIQFETREDGDELIDEALIYTAVTPEATEHALVYFWEAQEGQRFTQVVAVVPDSVSAQYF